MAAGTAVLSVHASDTHGDGLLADGTVFRDMQCSPMLVTTAVLSSAQGRVDALEPVSLGLLAQQFESILEGGRPDAARIGIMAGREQVEMIAAMLRIFRVPNVVLAPVFRIGKTPILSEEAMDALIGSLFPDVRVLLVRAGDLELLTGQRAESLDELRSAADMLRKRGAGAVLVSGGIRKGRVLDVLDDGGEVTVLDTTRLSVSRVDGLAGAHAAAVAGHLARGLDLRQAAAAAQRYVALRLQRGR
jgi:hydroxymethylpyrimidine kinase/phosphomethylpyrimidine kinase